MGETRFGEWMPVTVFEEEYDCWYGSVRSHHKEYKCNICGHRRDKRYGTCEKCGSTMLNAMGESA